MKQPVVMEDIEKITFLSQVKYNPKGDLVAYIKSKASLDENNYKSDIYIYNPKKKEHLRLTASECERSFYWLDDSTILFQQARTEKEKKDQKDNDVSHFYSIRINGGEAAPFLTIPYPVRFVDQLTEEQFLILKSTDLNGKDLYELSDQEKAKERERRESSNSYQIIEEIPFWVNGGSFISQKRTQLCVWDESKKRLKKLLDAKYYVEDISLNEEKTKALVITGQNKGKADLVTELRILDLTTLKIKKLPLNNKRIYGASFLDEKTLFLLINKADKLGLNQNSSFFTYDLETNKLQEMEKNDRSIGSSVGSDMRYGGGSSLRVKNGKIYFIETNGTDAYLVEKEIDSEQSYLVKESGSVDSFDVNVSEELAMVRMSENGLQELYIGKKKVSAFNTEYLETHTVSPVETVQFLSNGDPLDGFIIKPIGYKKGKTYPAILDIHGGPKTVYGSVFYHEMQVWANMGYFVFFCNPVGSDGKGDAFSDIRGKYGTIDYDNIMDFTDFVLEKYEDIDQKNVFVTGGSYGGFMTNWIVGHTDRFKAAATQRSISNWISMFGISDIGYFFANDQMDADPWKDMDKMWWHSPLKYANKVSTPLLFIHSDKDYRCPDAEGFQFFSALKFFGIETRFVLFCNETHELSRSGKPKNRLKRLQEITNWFESHK